MYNQTISKFRK